MDETASEPSQPSRNSVRSAFESLFDEDQEVENADSYFAQEEEVADSCSYETVDEHEADPVSDKGSYKSGRKTHVGIIKAEDEVSVPDFDLRKAVIYQTILSNKYLDEMHSTEN